MTPIVLFFLIATGLTAQQPNFTDNSLLLDATSGHDKAMKQRIMSGRVISAETSRPLSHVHVSILSTGLETASPPGTSTDENGYFELPLDSTVSMLLATRIGYATKMVPMRTGYDDASGFPGDTIFISSATITDNSPFMDAASFADALSYADAPYIEIYLQPETFRMDEVIINAAPRPGNGSHRNSGRQGESTEAFIERLDGVSMIKRANYAWEPTIRGMSAGRISVLIDDVKMVPACVDRMDPVTSYVETENLEKVEVSRGNFDLGNGNRPGGSLNLVTSRPGFDRGYFGRIDLGVQHNAAVHKYHFNTGYSNERTAVQTSIAFRDAGDFREGGGSTLSGSGYRKINLKLDADHKFSIDRTGRFTYIGDLAADIGYPALIMDTREARLQLFSYDYEWKQPAGSVSSLRIKPYHTRVDHWMDDYDRDVTSRDVMPDMYMPMFGYTRTTGLLINSVMYRDANLLDLGLHLHRLDAFADMLMEPLDASESDMYLLNVGDVRLDNSYVSAEYSWLPAGSWSFSGGISVELSDRSLRKKTAAGLFRAEYPGISTDRLWSTLSGSISVNYTHSDLFAVVARLSDGRRLPSHLEHYGYYIYNPADDHFYHGNPGLTPERSTQAEVNAMVSTSNRRAGVESALYFNYLQDYIDGGPASGNFRRYMNYGSAVMAGGELSVFVEPLENLRFATGGSYVHAENLELQEPLPMIPPLESFAEVTGQTGPFYLHTRIRLVAGQSRVADRSTLEVPSKGFFVADIEGRYRLFNRFDLHSGVRNLFDTWYREHTTPGQMAAPGRDMFVQIRYTW